MHITKEIMMDAASHLLEAERQIETMKYFVANKDRLSLDGRIPVAFSKLVYAVSALQQLFYNEEELHELFYKTIAEVSKDREYKIHTTKDNEGKQYFDFQGLLPLDTVKVHMILTGENNAPTIEVPKAAYSRTEPAD